MARTFVLCSERERRPPIQTTIHLYACNVQEYAKQPSESSHEEVATYSTHSTRKTYVRTLETSEVTGSGLEERWQDHTKTSHTRQTGERGKRCD